MECRCPVSENGKDALTKEGIEGIFLEWEYFRPASDEPSRRPSRGTSFPKKHSPNSRVPPNGRHRSAPGSPGFPLHRSRCRRHRSRREDCRSSRALSVRIDPPGLIHGPTMRLISDQLKEQSIVMPLAHYEGYLSSRICSASAIFPSRQFFVYQYHSALGTCRKIEGEDDPQILKPDLLNFQGHLALIADPSTIAAGLRLFPSWPAPPLHLHPVGIGAMNLIVFTDQTVFHPVGDSVRPQGCERPAGGRVDELLPGGLGMVDCLLHVLPQDPPILHKTLDFLGDMQTYLFICIHLFLGSAADLSEQSFLNIIPVFALP